MLFCLVVLAGLAQGAALLFVEQTVASAGRHPAGNVPPVPVVILLIPDAVDAGSGAPVHADGPCRSVLRTVILYLCSHG